MLCKIIYVACVFTQCISMAFISKTQLCKQAGFSLSRSHIASDIGHILSVSLNK